MTQIPQAPLQAPVLPERVFSAPAAVSEASSSAFSSLSASDGAATSQTRPSLAAQAGAMEKRLNRLLDKAAGGLPGLSGSLYERIRESVPRPGIFERQGRHFHQAMLDAAVKCDNAAAELAKIPAKSFLFLPLSDEHFQAVKNYTDAQNELYAQIRQFCGSMGSSPCLDSLLQATQFRASEALNLVASMQLVGREEAGLSPEESAIRREIAERLVDTDEQSGTLRGMQAMTPLMHGAVLSATLKNEVNGLFAEIDALEQRRGDIPLDEFKRSASALSAEAERLKGRVDALSNSGLQADMALKETLTGMLARSAARLDTMGKASPEQELSRAISDLLPHVDGNPLSDLHKSAPHPLKDALGYLAAGITSYNTGISSLKSDLESRGISNQEFRTRLNSAVDALRTDSARRACVMLHVMNNAHAGRLDSPDGFRRWYFHYTGENLQHSDAKKLLDYARNSSLFQQKETAKLIELISGVAITKPGIMSAELRELGAMHGRIESRSTAMRG